MSDFDKQWLEMMLDTIASSPMDDGQKKAMVNAAMQAGRENLDPFTMDEVEESLVKVIEKEPFLEGTGGWTVRVDVCEASHSFGFELWGLDKDGREEKIHAHFGYETADAARDGGQQSAEHFLKDMCDTVEAPGTVGHPQDRPAEGPDR